MTYQPVIAPLKWVAMDIYAARKARIWHLIEREFGGKKRRFADAIRGKREIESARSMVYRWFPRTETADTRAIEYETARQIEEALGLIPLCLESFDLHDPYRPRDVSHGEPAKEGDLPRLANSPAAAPYGSSDLQIVRPFARLFPLVDLHRYARLSPSARLKIQERMNDEIDLAEARAAAQQPASGKR